MKKIVLLCLSLIMCLLLCACGCSNESDMSADVIDYDIDTFYKD